MKTILWIGILGVIPLIYGDNSNLINSTISSVTMAPKMTRNDLENQVYGEPYAICDDNQITVVLETTHPFGGNVYAKGFFHHNECRVTGDGVGNAINITVPLDGECGMRKRRSISPKGISLEATVVLMFHRLLLTGNDRAFHVACTYAELDQHHTQHLDVAGEPTSELPVAPSKNPPVCKYEVLSMDGSPRPLTMATLGQRVMHRWSCQPTDGSVAFCLTVHTCVVDDGQDLRQELLDASGCPVDSVLLDAIQYDGDMVGYRESPVFKFADKPTVYFSCQLRITKKSLENGTCNRTSDYCISASNILSEPLSSKNPLKDTNTQPKKSESPTITSTTKKPTTVNKPKPAVTMNAATKEKKHNDESIHRTINENAYGIYHRVARASSGLMSSDHPSMPVIFSHPIVFDEPKKKSYENINFDISAGPLDVTEISESSKMDAYETVEAALDKPIKHFEDNNFNKENNHCGSCEFRTTIVVVVLSITCCCLLVFLAITLHYFCYGVHQSDKITWDDPKLKRGNFRDVEIDRAFEISHF